LDDEAGGAVNARELCNGGEPREGERLRGERQRFRARRTVRLASARLAGGEGGQHRPLARGGVRADPDGLAGGRR
jgi:hypothetical protein